ncbi:TPA: hypothetical protein ACGXP1_005684 [Bacillus cereus]|uniref:hypothetical protein n=1 Tax=Bacillus thuringiensis TaxID=1428 RepID=UPI002EC250D9|nr:hypothetical protein [Bacillus thuringiensis]
MKKKFSFIFIIATFLLTTVNLFGGQTAKADTITRYGKIINYTPHKAGSDEKWMTNNDCAVDASESYIKAGTKIVVTNLDKGKSRVLEKWDYGNFKHLGVIVDVLPDTFVALGGKLSEGYIKNGRTERSGGLAITE